MPMAPPSGDFSYWSCFGPSLTLWEASAKISSLQHTLKAPRCVGIFETSITSHRLPTGPALTATWVCCTVLVPCSHGPAKWTCWFCSWPLAALTAALKLLLPNQSATTLQTPTFGLTMSDQYDEFILFQESMESWFHLQAIPDEPDDKGAHLEYILNFLSTTGHWKWNQWTAAGATTDDTVATKKSLKSSWIN